VFISTGNKALNAVKEIYQNLVFFHLCFYFSINVSYCSAFCQLELLLNSLSEGGRARKKKKGGVVGAAGLLRQGVLSSLD
jgi:hypothetical protein